jgi:hypothetical protein
MRLEGLTLLAGAAGEHERLPRADGGLVIHLSAIEHGLGMGINIEAIGEAPADLADG